MIEINLLPGAGKKRGGGRQALDFGALASGVSGRMRDKFMVAAIVSVIIGVGAVGVLYTLQSRRETSLDARHEKAVTDSTRYANFLKDRYRSEAVRDTLLRQVNIIRSIDADRFVWPHVLDEISRALPQYTWLTSVTFAGTPQGGSNVVVTPHPADDKSAAAKKSGAPPKRLATDIPEDVISIRLMGRTVDIQALTRFMTDLEASPFFSNVQLDKSELAVDQGKEVTQFQLTIGYSRPDTSTLNRAPLSLSVR
jgi:Tfp pilus assembly protein PilN